MTITRIKSAFSLSLNIFRKIIGVENASTFMLEAPEGGKKSCRAINSQGSRSIKADLLILSLVQSVSGLSL